MKRVELDQATAPLAEYARNARREGVVVTVNGKPVATVQAVPDGSDWESLAVGMNPVFLEIVERSRIAHRKQGGISPDEMRRLFGIKARKSIRRRVAR